jgi:peptide/nickel transport system substrate-binding protein
MSAHDRASDHPIDSIPLNTVRFSAPLHDMERQMKEKGQRRRRLIRFTAIAAALVLGTGVAAWSAPSQPASAAVPQKLTVAFSEDITNLNPYGPADGQQSLQVVDGQIFNTLVTKDPKSNNKYLPSLATKWSEPNSLTWEFDLRKANFSDGTPVTASDVVADLQYLAKSASPLSSLWTSLDTVTAVNPQTVKITTTVPLGSMLADLTLLDIAPASDITKADFGTNPIGSGPFKITSFSPENKVVLTANKGYWGGAPKLQSLTFSDIPDESARLTALKDGEVDLVWVVSPDQVSTLTDASGIKLKVADSDAYFFIWFNASQKPFNDVRVRQAMWYAVNAKAVDKSLFGDAGKTMTSPIPSTVFGSSTQDPYPYDPAKAKKLLAEAGYPHGFSTSIILAADSAPLIQEQAQAYASYWAKVGVKVQIESQPQAVWLQNLLALKWSMDIQENVVLTGDADYTLGRLYTSSADRTGYKNPQLDTLLSQASQTTDQTKRAQLYKQASKIIWSQAVGIFPLQERDTYAVKSTVKGFTPTPNRVPSFLKVSIGN